VMASKSSRLTPIDRKQALRLRSVKNQKRPSPDLSGEGFFFSRTAKSAGQPQFPYAAMILTCKLFCFPQRSSFVVEGVFRRSPWDLQEFVNHEEHEGKHPFRNPDSD